MLVHARAVAVCALVASSVRASGALAQSPELTGLARAAGDKHILSCIRVALEDSAGHEVASARTDARGLFALSAPVAGVYRLRFEMPIASAVRTPVDTLAAGAYSERVYELPFVVPDSSHGRFPSRMPGDLLAKPNGVFPHYPRSLQEANVEGGAVAELVVDSVGNVDARSIRIVRATHTEFGRSVTDALPRMVFYPQHDRGIAVCQRIIQPFAFELSR